MLNLGKMKKIILEKINNYEKEQGESFLDWLQSKIGIRFKKEIGHGDRGVVFDIGKRALKITTEYPSEIIPLLNRKIPGIAKVYSIGKIKVPKKYIKNVSGHNYVELLGHDLFLNKKLELYFIIMDLLDTRTVEDDLRYLENTLLEYVQKSEFGETPFRYLFNQIIKGYDISNLVNYVKRESPENYDILKELINIFKSISKYYDWVDIHPFQFGRDYYGNLVAFDLDNYYGEDFKYEPKTVIETERIEENKNFIKKLLRNKLINEDIDKHIWYHGSPDLRDIEKNSGFEERTKFIEYIPEIDKYEKIQKEMIDAHKKGIKKKYIELLDEIVKLKKKYKITKPIFLTNVYSVAKTYANPHRAFDYQKAKSGVLKVIVKNGKNVIIDASGDRFKFIDVSKVKKGFVSAGVNPNEFDKVLSMFNFNIRDKSRITTDLIAVLGYWFGFDYIDLLGVLDAYEGGDVKSTVRMVLNPNLIKIVK